MCYVFVVRCHMPSVRCCLSSDMCPLSPLACHLWHVTCHLRQQQHPLGHWVKISPIIIADKGTFNKVSVYNLKQAKKFIVLYSSYYYTNQSPKYTFKNISFELCTFWKNCLFWIAMESGSESVTYQFLLWGTIIKIWSILMFYE